MISDRQASAYARKLRKRVDLFQELVDPQEIEELSQYYQQNPTLSIKEKWNAESSLNALKIVLRL